MVQASTWCDKCQKMVITDIKMESVKSNRGELLYIRCKGWYCPVCGNDLIGDGDREV